MPAPLSSRPVPLACLGLGAVLALTPWATPALALAGGIACAVGPGNPWTRTTGVAGARLMQASIVALGFGLPLQRLLAMGARGIAWTALTIASVFLLGLALGRWLRVDRHLTILVSAGTSICGGSAIAAVSPAIGATREATSVSLATVFILNAAALYLFPPIGHALGLSQHQFGVWAAMAIHDTSSVVGAATMFGAEALADATVLKLARAMWIVPLVVAAALASHRSLRATGQRLPIPWFVGLFVVAAALRSVLPDGSLAAMDTLARLGRVGLVLTLFLVGASLSPAMLRQVGPRPFTLGVVLWLVVSGTTLAVVRTLLA